MFLCDFLSVKRLCYRCRKPGHLAKNCPYMDRRDMQTWMDNMDNMTIRTCIHCGMRGHFGWECQHVRRLCSNMIKRPKTEPTDDNQTWGGRTWNDISLVKIGTWGGSSWYIVVPTRCMTVSPIHVHAVFICVSLSQSILTNHYSCKIIRDTEICTWRSSLYLRHICTYRRGEGEDWGYWRENNTIMSIAALAGNEQIKYESWVLWMMRRCLNSLLVLFESWMEK